MVLSKRKRIFLFSYYSRLLESEIAAIQQKRKEDFIQSIVDSDFDNPITEKRNKIAAQELQKDGVLEELVFHKVVGEKYIYVIFNRNGAEALYEVISQPLSVPGK